MELNVWALPDGAVIRAATSPLASGSPLRSITLAFSVTDLPNCGWSGE